MSADENCISERDFEDVWVCTSNHPATCFSSMTCVTSLPNISGQSLTRAAIYFLDDLDHESDELP